jgi:hypothetical protein
MDIRLSWLSKSCTAYYRVPSNLGPVCLLFGLIWDTVRAECYIVVYGIGRPQYTAMHRVT